MIDERLDIGASALADRAGGLRPEPAALSQPKALIPSACRPVSVFGHEVTPAQIAMIIDGLANVPRRFKTMALLSMAPEPPHPGQASVWFKQELFNRLFQRWRKMGLVEHLSGGRWSLTRGAWAALQASAIEARRAETAETGSVHESAGPQDDAQPSPEVDP